MLRNVLLLCAYLVVVSGEAQTPPAASSIGIYRYDQWDVFTDEPLTGNQLAVFMEPAGLADDLMQNIAREMAFSETTFVFPPEG